MPGSFEGPSSTVDEAALASSPEERPTSAEMRACTRILSEIAQDRGLLAELSVDERRTLLIAAGKVASPDRDAKTRFWKASRKKLKKESFARDCEARASTGIRRAREHTVFVPPPQLTKGPGTPAGPRTAGATHKSDHVPVKLERPRHCYVCKSDYLELHFFYDAMCQTCGDFNYAKRFQTAPLHGRVAVITGARVKIGYHAALMMLRAGAQVIVTTRFPHDAALRFAREPDFEAWSSRVSVHGLDLRHAPSVELFSRYLLGKLDRLDFLINNAAQTVRRPPGFYAHLLKAEEAELEALPEGARVALRSHYDLKHALAGASAAPLRLDGRDVGTRGLAAFGDGAGEVPGVGVRASAALSQIPYSLADAALGEEVFPTGALDQDLQQVDLRSVNSWRLALADVPTAEMLEVQLVNAVSPFILCAKLKPLMIRAPGAEKHVVNVSAMEGQFSRRTKTDKHPHTNMAKAALNMMTLTSAPDYLQSGIHMNAVDTGWVTDEDPQAITRRKQSEMDFHPPLDIVDGAARICDPFFAGLLTGHHVWGKFLKDYAPAPW